MRGMQRYGFFLAVFMLMGACQVWALGGYKELLWIDAMGYTIHTAADGNPTLTTFLRYREVRFEKNTRKPGHFLCNQDGIDKEIPVRDISGIRLKLPLEQLQKTAREDRLRNVVLTMKDGSVYDVTVERNLGFALANDDFIEFKYWDPVTGAWAFGGVAGDTLREVRFQ